MDKLTASMSKLDFTVGDQYNTLLISFGSEPRRPSRPLSRSRCTCSPTTGPRPRPSAPASSSSPPTRAAQAIADATGFRYRRLQNGQYYHPVCIFVITPEGKVSRYFYGFDYPARDVKLAHAGGRRGQGRPLARRPRPDVLLHVRPHQGAVHTPGHARDADRRRDHDDRGLQHDRRAHRRRTPPPTPQGRKPRSTLRPRDRPRLRGRHGPVADSFRHPDPPKAA